MRRFFARPVERLVRRVVFCATSISERRALFTASSLGNASATLGLRTTIFDDLRKRLAYFPRTKPPGKSDNLYSARNSSLFVCLALFIYLSLSFARQASTYDSNRFIFLSMGH